jgi:hypothetical protein
MTDKSLSRVLGVISAKQWKEFVATQKRIQRELFETNNKLNYITSTVYRECMQLQEECDAANIDMGHGLTNIALAALTLDSYDPDETYLTLAQQIGTGSFESWEY